MAKLWDSFFLGLDYPSPACPFDHRLLEECLTYLAGHGLRGLRLPLTWADFQPEPRHLSDRCLRDLEVAMNLAAAYRLGLIPVLFSQGEGGFLLPSWASPDERLLLEGQLHLVEVLTGYFGGHRALLVWELDARGAVDPVLMDAWRDVLLPAARRGDPRHPLALGLTGDHLLRGDQALLEGLAPSFDLIVLEWSASHRLAPLACALAWRLAQRRALVSLGQAPLSDREMEETLGALLGDGALGAVLPGPEGQGRVSEEAWAVLRHVAAQGWPVGAEPPAIALEPQAFYEDPQVSWQTLCRGWEGRW